MVLGFMAATGEPVLMCTVVLEETEVKPEWVTGIKIFAKQVGLETDGNVFFMQFSQGQMICNGTYYLFL